MTCYKLRTDKLYCEDAGNYIAYGINIYNEETKNIILSIKNISLKKEPLELLIKKCNKLQPDIMHIADIIEDFLVEY